MIVVVRLTGGSDCRLFSLGSSSVAEPQVEVRRSKRRRQTVSAYRDGDKIVVGYNTPYALLQHENLEYNHAPGRSAKYLEKSANGAGRAIEQIFKRELDQ